MAVSIVTSFPSRVATSIFPPATTGWASNGPPAFCRHRMSPDETSSRSSSFRTASTTNASLPGSGLRNVGGKAAARGLVSNRRTAAIAAGRRRRSAHIRRRRPRPTRRIPSRRGLGRRNASGQRNAADRGGGGLLGDGRSRLGDLLHQFLLGVGDLKRPFPGPDCRPRRDIPATGRHTPRRPPGFSIPLPPGSWRRRFSPTRCRGRRRVR